MAEPTPSRRRAGALAMACLAGLVLAGCGLWPPRASGPPPSFAASPDAEVLVGAGDIGRCDSDADEATARLLDAIDGVVFTTGDNAYRNGSPRDFERCYAPSWGRHLERTRFPAPGNHDHETEDAAGYRAYFGDAAAPDGATWYAGRAGTWQVIVLDANCEAVGGCDEGSPQGDWLRETLAASDARCTLALWHQPRFSSGEHGNYEPAGAFWRALHEAGAEIVINGHDHDYERFAPQDPDARPDPDRGIRQFVVGTGGADLRSFEAVQANSEVRDAETHGVLRLELAPTSYRWDFVGVAGTTFRDSGSGDCH